MSKITTLIFDYDGVFLPDEYRGIKKICPDEDAVENIEKKYYDKPTCSGLWSELRDRFSLSVTDTELGDFYNSEDDFQRQYKKTIFSLAKELSKRFSLVLLSNQIKVRADYLRSKEDFSSFSNIFFSNEIGLKKPDASIFSYVLIRIEKTPQSCLFIDDAVENTEIASRLGLEAYLYKDLGAGSRYLRELLKKF